MSNLFPPEGSEVDPSRRCLQRRGPHAKSMQLNAPLGYAPCAIGEPAAVHRDDRAANVARQVRAQQHEIGNVSLRTKAAQRHCVDCARARLLQPAEPCPRSARRDPAPPRSPSRRRGPTRSRAREVSRSTPAFAAHACACIGIVTVDFGAETLTTGAPGFRRNGCAARSTLNVPSRSMSTTPLKALLDISLAALIVKLTVQTTADRALRYSG